VAEKSVFAKVCPFNILINKTIKIRWRTLYITKI